MRRIVHFSALILLLAAPAFAGTTTWQIDPDHTSAQFAIKHLMVSTVRGTMGPVTGTVTIDDSDITKSSVTASIDAKGIDTRNQKRDDHLRSPDFFDVARFPAMTFRSRSFERAGDRWKVSGDLSLHGVTRPVVLDSGPLSPESRDPYGVVKVGTSATAAIRRKDFGLTWNRALETGGIAVGDEVQIVLDLEFNRRK